MKVIQRFSAFIICGLCGTLSTLSAQQNDINKAIRSAKQGAIVSLPGILSSPMQDLRYTRNRKGVVQLLMSDDPEYIADSVAIVLKEQVKAGDVRLYVYNVNGVQIPHKMARKIIAVIKNTGVELMHFQMKHSASMDPSEKYYEIGKMGLANFFLSKPKPIREIKPGETVLVDPLMDKRIANYNELVHGLYEFQIDQPGEVVVLQTSPESDYKNAASQIHYIVPPAHANAGRGLFSPANYAVNITDTLDTKGVQYVLKVADGKKDPWMVGKESNFNKTVELAGNYGVIYDISIPWKSSDGRGLALFTWNPLSGIDRWCDGMASSMVVSEGKFKAGVAILPSESLTVNKSPDAILIQIFPAQDGVQYIHLKYSPPGASCLPTPFLFLPVQ